MPVVALGRPDLELHHLPVSQTMRPVGQSPDADANQPLSQAVEISVRTHYDLPPRPDATPHEPHIPNLTGLNGYSIEATHGDIGHAEDFLIDTTRWQVRYLTVDTSREWTNEKRLISTLSIDWMDRTRSIIHLAATCQRVKRSPLYVAAETVDGAFGEWIHTYTASVGPGVRPYWQ